tara:strand:- start:1777 stop:1983 length:207 start_codon:yes stop_codon:yes gene_type:complete
MISFLEHILPLELVEIVALHLHRQYMKDVIEIINYKIVFIMTSERMSFLVCERQNYYKAIEIENGNWN